MAFGDDPGIERFHSDYFEEQDGHIFLRPPKGQERPAPISYELYLELVNAYETDLRIAKTLQMACTMSGVLFGAYRWFAHDDLLQTFLSAAVGFGAGLIAYLVVHIRVPLRMGLIYEAKSKIPSQTRYQGRAADDLF